MLLQRKAVYNLIQLNLSKILTGELKVSDLEPWQLEDYRALPTENLFLLLNELHVKIEAADFEKYRRIFEDPEEMTDSVAEGRNPLEQDRIFLIIFELWRRFFPEKRSLSIFCDELDYQMTCYDLEKPNKVQDSLIYLQKLLEHQVDGGLAPKEAFHIIQEYCANDIESFLFDYILAEIEQGNLSNAVELLEGFSVYVSSIWFDYLKTRTSLHEDSEEGYELLEKLVNKVTRKTNLDLVKEILFFLAMNGTPSLFSKLAKKATTYLEIEGDFQEILEGCYAHFDHLELKIQALTVAEIFNKRSSIDLNEPLSQEDPDLLKLRQLLNQKFHI